MAEDKISQKIDQYFDRSRKTISQWVTAHINAELQRVNGNIIFPVKKPLQDIFNYIVNDPHLSSVLQQRKSKVLGEEFAIVQADGNIDDESTKRLSKKWFNKFQEAIVDSRFYGYNLIEIQELIDSEIKDIKVISRGNVIPELKSIVKNPYQVSQGSLIQIEQRNDSDYYILIDSETLGILNQVVPLVMIKRLTLSMWGEHSQTYGLPMTILKTDDKDQIGKYQQDMQKFVSNRNVIIGLSDQLEMLTQSGTDPFKIYQELINTCNAEISKAILSVTMTTDDGSSRSQGEVHERVANEVSDQDREYVTYMLNDVVFPKLIALGYALTDRTFRYISKEKRSYTEKLATIEKLKQNGFSIDPDSVQQYLDLPFTLENVEVQELNPTVSFNIQKKSPVIRELLNWYDNSGCNAHEIVNSSVDGVIDDFYNGELEGIVDGIISDIYSTYIDPLDANYIRAVGELISKAIYNSFDFNGDFDNPDFDSEDLEFIKALRQNTYYFVGGKNKALKQSFTELLLDGKNLKTFSQFKLDCKRVGLEFNHNHLKTEYQTAISNAQSASDWASFGDDDLLEYSAVLDGRTRPEHSRLNGLILPKSDPLWNSIAPINSWGCRCRLIGVPNGKQTKLMMAQKKEFKGLVDKDFKFNPGTTGNLFPTNHPYLKILRREDKMHIDTLL